VKILVLGTCCSTHFPRQGCDCPSCQDPTFQRRKNSSILLKDIMIDCGKDWVNIPRQVKNIAITHMHPDHAFGLKYHQNKDINFYMTKDIKHFLLGYKIIQDSDRIKTVEYFKTYNISGSDFNFYPILHSDVVPSTCIKIDKKLLYCPDMREILKRSLVFKDVKTYIGDGSTLTRDVYTKLVGHKSIIHQMELAKQYGVQKIFFTHIGHIKLSHAQLNQKLQDLNKETYHFKEVKVLREGDILSI
jgi:phosphoribosyl 1,2-cyclic phosphodiesterase